MQLDGGLPRSKPRPWKYRQAKVNGGGVEGVDCVVKVEAKRFGSIHRAGNVDEHLRKVGVDPPVMSFVGIRQGGSRDPAPDAHVVQLAIDRSKTRFNVPQTLPGRSVEQMPGQETDRDRKIRGIYN